MALEPIIDPGIEPLYCVAHLLGGIVICDNCKCEALFVSDAPNYSNQRYYDQASVAYHQGWIVLSDHVRVLCPTCASRNGGAI
jgi:hypothetical protein